MVRLAAEKLPDPRGLAVGEPKGAVKRLFRDLRQVIQSNREDRRAVPKGMRGGVARRHLAMLALLALIWGSSFVFIKVAVREPTPATLITGRLGLAALTLALVVPATVGSRPALLELRENWFWLTAVALVNSAIPFWLLSWGETRLDSGGLASIIQAPGRSSTHFSQSASTARCA
jgi:hypothetical protein